LRPEEAQGAVGREPEVGVEGADGAGAVGVNHEDFLPRFSAVAAGGEDDVVVVVLFGSDAGIPDSPEASGGRDRHAGDALEGAVGRGVLRLGRGDVLRRVEKRAVGLRVSGQAEQGGEEGERQLVA
jgi:hypothetical protein